MTAPVKYVMHGQLPVPPYTDVTWAVYNAPDNTGAQSGYGAGYLINIYVDYTVVDNVVAGGNEQPSQVPPPDAPEPIVPKLFFVMKALCSLSNPPNSMVTWKVADSPDFTGAQSGFPISSLSDIIVDYTINDNVTSGPQANAVEDFLLGDVTGGFYDTTVERIRHINVDATAPTLAQLLQYNGTDWKATTLGGDLSVAVGDATVVGFQGRPVDPTAPTTNQVYAWDGVKWAPISIAVGPAGGDLGGFYPNPDVLKIHGASVPVAGSLTTGNVLQVTGPSALSYGPVNLAGGSDYVTGGLPLGNLGGDVSGTSEDATVIGIRGKPITPGSAFPFDGYILRFDGGLLEWDAVSQGTLPLSGDVTGTANNNVVTTISGTGTSGLVAFNTYVAGDQATSNPFKLKTATVNMTSDADLTLSASQFINPILTITSTPTLISTRNIILPTTAGAAYLVYNNTNGTQDLIFKTSGGTGVTVGIQKHQLIWCDGTNYVKAEIPDLAIAGDVTGSLAASTVVKLQNRNVSSAAPTDSYVLTWNAGSNQWEPSISAGGPPSGPAGGDLRGTYPNPRVQQASGSSNTESISTFSVIAKTMQFPNYDDGITATLNRIIQINDNAGGTSAASALIINGQGGTAAEAYPGGSVFINAAQKNSGGIYSLNPTVSLGIRDGTETGTHLLDVDGYAVRSQRTLWQGYKQVTGDYNFDQFNDQTIVGTASSANINIVPNGYSSQFPYYGNLWPVTFIGNSIGSSKKVTIGAGLNISPGNGVVVLGSGAAYCGTFDASNSVVGGILLAGDLAGTGSSASTPRVSGINSATVPAAGSLTTGNVLQVSGSSALSYGPVNIAGGSNYITGVLPYANLPSLAGDVQGAYDSNIVTTITGAGGSVTLKAILTGDNNLPLRLAETTITLTSASDYTLTSSDLAFPKIVFRGTVITSSINIICPSTTGATIMVVNEVVGGPNLVFKTSGGIGVSVQTNQTSLITYNGVLADWTTVSSAPGGVAGGDLSGFYPNPVVAAISGTSPIVITPAELQFKNSTTTPIIDQAALASLPSGGGATGQLFTIKAQDGQGTATSPGGTGGEILIAGGDGGVSGITGGNGGDVVLKPGVGNHGGISGSIRLFTGNGPSTRLVIDDSGTINIPAFSAGIVHVDGGSNLSSSLIVNADISSIAAIDVAKLAAGTAAQLLLNNSTPTPTWTTVTGDVTISSSGVTTVNSISGASPIAITPSKLQWTSGTSVPSLEQASTSSADGQSLLVQAQSATGATHNGGNLLLAAGTSGSATAGSVILKTAGATRLTAGATGVITIANLSTGVVHADSSGNLTSSNIVNADVDSAAAIAYSKLNLSGSIVNADVNASAAIAYSKLNLASSIVNADISSSAAIAVSKLAAGTAGQILQNNGTPTPTWTTISGDISIGNTGAVTVTKIQGNAVKAETEGATQDGYVLTWVNANNEWEAKPASGGVTTVGTIDSQTKSANGAVISGSSIYMQTADATNVGLVSTGTQTIAGAKTLTGNTTVSGTLTASSTCNLGSSTTKNTYSGGQIVETFTCSSSLTLGDGYFQVFVDTSAARSITLPAPANGRTFWITDTIGTAETNNITLVRNGSEKINGVAASKVLQTNWGSWRVISNGTDWFVNG